MRKIFERAARFPRVEAVGLLYLSLLTGLFLWRRPPMDLGDIFRSTLLLAQITVMIAPTGLVARFLWEALRGRGRAYWNTVRSGAWLRLTARLLLLHWILLSVYTVLKLLVPFFHPGSFDLELWNIDRALLLGFSPNSLFLELLRQPQLLRGIDFVYTEVFLAFITLTFPFYLSDVSNARREAFFVGNGLLWFFGVALYLVIPSIGPIYRFPEVFSGTDAFFPHTRFLQTVLIKNYTAFEKSLSGISASNLTLSFGVAAFPSLHVAFESYVAMCIHRDFRRVGKVAWFFAIATVFGSVLTGWHYLVDALAGLLMAWICYRLAGLHKLQTSRSEYPLSATRLPLNPEKGEIAIP